MHESHASPILKSTYTLLQLTTRVLAGFTRDFKYSLGDKLRNEVVSLVLFVCKAKSCNADREALVVQITEQLQVINLLVRISKDMRLVTVKQFSEVVVLTDSIGRQAQDLVKSSLLAES